MCWAASSSAAMMALWKDPQPRYALSSWYEPFARLHVATCPTLMPLQLTMGTCLWTAVTWFCKVVQNSHVIFWYQLHTKSQEALLECSIPGNLPVAVHVRLCACHGSQPSKLQLALIISVHPSPFWSRKTVLQALSAMNTIGARPCRAQLAACQCCPPQMPTAERCD